MYKCGIYLHLCCFLFKGNVTYGTILTGVIIMRIECFNTPSLDCDIDLCFCGYEDCVPEFTCGPYIRDSYLIHYILKGEGYYEVNGNKYEVKEGSIFTIFPGSVTFYATYPEDPWSFCWFAFNGKKSMDFLASAGISHTTPVQSLDSIFRIDGLINNCIDLLKDDSKLHNIKLRGYLYLILSNLEESYIMTEQKQKQRGKSSEYIESAVTFIEYNYMKEITVQGIANYVGLERTYFSKLFHNSMGMSPQNYICQYRIEKACQLIKSTDLNNKQIGQYCGVEDEFYFSRLFKRIKGITPAEFRKKHNFNLSL
jgi:AraC-like DNA-binding protein